MLSNKPTRTLLLPTALCLLTILLAASATAQRADRVLHTFNNTGVDGFNPSSALIFDTLGNLYGTTQRSGTQSGGTVFELIPHAGGFTRTYGSHSSFEVLSREIAVSSFMQYFHGGSANGSS
jgi:hypothetical protein